MVFQSHVCHQSSPSMLITYSGHTLIRLMNLTFTQSTRSAFVIATSKNKMCVDRHQNTALTYSKQDTEKGSWRWQGWHNKLIYFGYNADVTYLLTLTRSNIALLVHKFQIMRGPVFLSSLDWVIHIVNRVHCAQTTCCILFSHSLREVTGCNKQITGFNIEFRLSVWRQIYKNKWRLSYRCNSYDFLRIYLEHAMGTNRTRLSQA